MTVFKMYPIRCRRRSERIRSSILDPTNKVYGSTLRRFLGAKAMRNEWCTMHAKCLSRRDQTEHYKDTKNCSWVSYDKTAGVLCLIFWDVFGIFWSLKFLSNGCHMIGSYYNKFCLVLKHCEPESRSILTNLMLPTLHSSMSIMGASDHLI